jgi:hypothetical protein
MPPTFARGTRGEKDLLDGFAERVGAGLAVLHELDEQQDPTHNREKDKEIVSSLAPDVV